jgi:hypothetical protein
MEAPLKTIIRPDGTPIGVVNEWMTESDFRNKCPMFFRTPHGKRETFNSHRGCLIVRNTVTFSGSKPARMTAVYLFFPDGFIEEGRITGRADTFCVSSNASLSSIRQAERFIDHILDSGKYESGV